MIDATERDRTDEHESASVKAAAAERLSLESCLRHFTTSEVLSHFLFFFFFSSSLL